MRIVACGGRTRLNRTGAYSALEAMREAIPGMLLAQGHAVGYDKLVRVWAERNKVPCTDYAIDSKLDGYRDDAPKKRNARMFYDFKPDACLAFPGGPGTRHMFSLCLDAGLPVYDVSFTEGRFMIWQCRKGRQGLVFREGPIAP